MFQKSRLRQQELATETALRMVSTEQQANRLLNSEIRLLKARLEAQRDDIHRLLKTIEELQSRPVPERSKTPLYMSEDEEDIQFMRDTQMISVLEAQDMLRELEFDNESIVVYDDAETSIY